VARFGGDEFAVLQIGSRDDAIVLASRLLDAVSASFEIEGHRINIGMSIGIARAPDNGMDGDQLLMNADIALYRAKAEGRNGFRFFEPEMDIEARTRRHLEVSLRESVSRVERSAGNDFILHYHDIINVATGAVCGREALVRWYHPERGMVAPNKFIRAAEELGLIIPLGKWIVGRACADAATWPETLKLAVNLSPAQFRDDSLVESIMVALQASGLAPDRLELEITESVLLKNNPHDISILHQLKDLGISIVLDDFGTGYSSLSYLRLFPFDKLKIDKSFVDELTRRADCAAIICAIAGLGRSLSITTTAEGVETQEQFGLLRAAGCTQVQGFLFGRPRPAADIGRSDRAQQPLQAS
jgi:predicted signal transduction protein with EAL and GGDEF domain